VDELKAQVFSSLEANGFLAQIRAQLKVSVYEALNKNAGEEEGIQAKMLHEAPRGTLLLEVVADFLDFFGLQRALSVLAPEARLPSPRRGRAEVAAEAGLPTLIGERSILDQLISSCIDGRTSSEQRPKERPAAQKSVGSGANVGSAVGAVASELQPRSGGASGSVVPAAPRDKGDSHVERSKPSVAVAQAPANMAGNVSSLRSVSGDTRSPSLVPATGPRSRLPPLSGLSTASLSDDCESQSQGSTTSSTRNKGSSRTKKIVASAASSAASVVGSVTSPAGPIAGTAAAPTLGLQFPSASKSSFPLRPSSPPLDPKKATLPHPVGSPKDASHTDNRSPDGSTSVASCSGEATEAVSGAPLMGISPSKMPSPGAGSSDASHDAPSGQPVATAAAAGGKHLNSLSHVVSDDEAHEEILSEFEEDISSSVSASHSPTHSAEDDGQQGGYVTGRSRSQRMGGTADSATFEQSLASALDSTVSHDISVDSTELEKCDHFEQIVVA